MCFLRHFLIEKDDDGARLVPYAGISTLLARHMLLLFSRVSYVYQNTLELLLPGGLAKKFMVTK